LLQEKCAGNFKGSDPAGGPINRSNVLYGERDSTHCRGDKSGVRSSVGGRA